MLYIEYLRERVKFMNSGIGRRLRMTIVSIAAATCACVWWFVLYPELCFPEETYEIVCSPEKEEESCKQLPQAVEGEVCEKLSQAGEEENCEQFLQAEKEREICSQLLQADEEQVIVRSRLLEWLKQRKN